jgi:hypothetical protein
MKETKVVPLLPFVNEFKVKQQVLGRTYGNNFRSDASFYVVRLLPFVNEFKVNQQVLGRTYGNNFRSYASFYVVRLRKNNDVILYNFMIYFMRNLH